VAVARAADTITIKAVGETVELLHFPQGVQGPTILVSPGSGGHPYVFAELAYLLHRRGYSVLVMPKHGGRTVDELVTRHRDVLDHIADRFGDSIGVYGEGLGGYVAFYLALARVPCVSSIACQNSPAVLTEHAYHQALLADDGPWTRAAHRRRLMLPIGRRLIRFGPWLWVPIASYLPWQDLVDTREGVREVERRLVRDGYLKDPDFDRWYPLSAVMSLIDTPPPAPLGSLTIPTMFVVASEGPTPDYIRELYQRLPLKRKRIVDVEGSVYWMLSHPQQSAALIADWFAASLRAR
jgi:alpha-beta hydrolase superfamily lysophospholipase